MKTGCEVQTMLLILSSFVAAIQNNSDLLRLTDFDKSIFYDPAIVSQQTKKVTTVTIVVLCYVIMLHCIMLHNSLKLYSKNI